MGDHCARQVAHQSAESRNHVDVLFVRVQLPFVREYQLRSAVDLRLNVAAADVPQNPQLRPLLRQTRELRDLAQRNGFVDFADAFEVKEVQPFDHALLERPQKDVGADHGSALRYLSRGGLEVVLDLKEGDELSERVGVAHDFAVDDLNEFEEIEVAVVSIVLKRFVDDQRRDDVAQQLRTRQLQHRKVAFVGSTDVDPAFEVLVAGRAEGGEERQKQELFLLGVEFAHEFAVLRGGKATSRLSRARKASSSAYTSSIFRFSASSVRPVSRPNSSSQYSRAHVLFSHSSSFSSCFYSSNKTERLSP